MFILHAVATRLAQYPSRQLPIKAGILLTFILVPFWFKFPNAPAPFTSHYVTGFVIIVPMIWTIVWWLIMGLPGLAMLRKDRLFRSWMMTFLSFVLWMFISGNWAYMRSYRPEVALGASLQFGLVALFVICVACAELSPRWLIVVFVSSLIIHSTVGALQVAGQSSLGMFALGERVLNPQQSGISVVQMGSIRWLRPYGMTAHPNMFAGFLVIGLLATSPMMLSSRKILQWLGTCVFLFGLWNLFLTFSRGAWVGFMAGAIMLLFLLARYQPVERAIRRHVLYTLGMAVILGLLFMMVHKPLLLVRTTIGNQHTEERSVNERLVLLQIAGTTMSRYPFFGVGAGNFPWFASYYIAYETNYDVRGQNVHLVFLSVQAELGIIGLVLYVSALVLGLTMALRDLSAKDNSNHRYAFISGFVALSVIGLFDHYPGTVVHFQILWWGLLGVSVIGYQPRTVTTNITQSS